MSIYDTLNEEQKAVVLAPIDKNIRIVASAGSGKTTTILYRIKYLLEKEVDPSTIMLTTFNVDAAEVFKDRLKNKLKVFLNIYFLSK
jgi:superfamily I DNA/RNA helicase